MESIGEEWPVYMGHGSMAGHGKVVTSEKEMSTGASCSRL